jgi:hypothetical protein
MYNWNKVSENFLANIHELLEDYFFASNYRKIIWTEVYKRKIICHVRDIDRLL